MSDDLTRPSGYIVKVTKDDSATLILDDGRSPRALCCGTAGAVSMIDHAGNTLTNYPLQQGYNPISVEKVLTTGTSSADDIWALY